VASQAMRESDTPPLWRGDRRPAGPRASAGCGMIPGQWADFRKMRENG
jgi:hypothetical protein